MLDDDFHRQIQACCVGDRQQRKPHVRHPAKRQMLGSQQRHRGRRQAEEHAYAGQRDQRLGQMMQPRRAPPPEQQITEREQRQQRGSIQQAGRDNVADHQAAVEPRERVVLLRIVCEDEPRRIDIERPHDVAVNQPRGQRLLDRHEQWTDAPVKRADRDAKQAVQDQRGIPAIRRLFTELNDFLRRRAQRQRDRIAMAAATSAHMTCGRPLHVAQRHERRAVHWNHAVPMLALR
ncbi:hypothetical protein DFQ30_001658, partial [Apophysomyces sp. BC1015]